MQVTGALMQRLVAMGAAMQGPTYVVEGKRYRVLGTPGQLMSKIRASFDALADRLPPADVVICVSATMDRGATDIVRPEKQPSVVRASFGGEWLTDAEALPQLGMTHGAN